MRDMYREHWSARGDLCLCVLLRVRPSRMCSALGTITAGAGCACFQCQNVETLALSQLSVRDHREEGFADVLQVFLWQDEGSIV